MAGRSVEWAAGLFEGEGCVYIETPKPPNRANRRYVRLVVGSTDLDVLIELLRIFDCGAIHKHTGADHRSPRKPLWQWRVGAAHDVEHALRLLLPYMCERRTAKIKEALTWLAAA